MDNCIYVYVPYQEDAFLHLLFAYLNIQRPFRQIQRTNQLDFHQPSTPWSELSFYLNVKIFLARAWKKMMSELPACSNNKSIWKSKMLTTVIRHQFNIESQYKFNH